MKLQITLIPSNTRKTLEVQTNALVSDVLEQLHLKPDTVIVTKDTIPVPVDEVVTGMKELKIIQVASGG